MRKVFAQVTLPDGTKIDGPKDFKFAGGNLSDVVSAAIPYLFYIAGFLLLGYIIWGGFNYLTAMGDPKKAAAGKAKITNAIIGFVLIFTAFWITQIINFVFKLDLY